MHTIERFRIDPDRKELRVLTRGAERARRRVRRTLRSASKHGSVVNHEQLSADVDEVVEEVRRASECVADLRRARRSTAVDSAEVATLLVAEDYVLTQVQGAVLRLMCLAAQVGDVDQAHAALGRGPEAAVEVMAGPGATVVVLRESVDRAQACLGALAVVDPSSN